MGPSSENALNLNTKNNKTTKLNKKEKYLFFFYLISFFIAVLLCPVFILFIHNLTVVIIACILSFLIPVICAFV
jgi:hypothetical protein